MTAASLVYYLLSETHVELSAGTIISRLLEGEGAKSTVTHKFWNELKALPPTVQACAKDTFARWKLDPYNPAFHFKRIASMRGDVWSVRIVGVDGYRALAYRTAPNTFEWNRVCIHRDYDRVIASRKL